MEMSKKEQMAEQEREQIGDWMKVEFESVSENEELARVIAAVFVSRLNPTLEEMDDIKTAVSEAVTNAVRHGYCEETGIISMEMQIDGKIFCVTVSDGGVGIADVEKAMEPMYSSDPDGESAGMGFSFMEAFMDTLNVDSAPGEGTRVTMTKVIGKVYE